MKLSQKHLVFLFNLIIVAALCFASQFSVSAQAPAQGAIDTPPLFPDITWKDLGNVQKDVYVYDQILNLSGNMFAAIEIYQNGIPESVFNYYSARNLESLGWNSVGRSGFESTYRRSSGRYLTVRIEDCPNFPADYCVNVWQSVASSSIPSPVGRSSVDPLSAASVTALAALNKITPTNGSTIALPTSTQHLLQWSDAGIGSTDRYQYCIDETNNQQCDSTWIQRNSLYSGNGEFTLTSGHTYYWQVKVRDANVYANGGTWWSFTIPQSFPTVQSIVRPPLALNPTNANIVNFVVTFSQVVTGVDAGDFTLSTTGVSGAGIIGVAGSGQTYTVTVGTGSGTGTVQLNLIDNDTIKNNLNTPLGGTGIGNGSFTTGETYKIDKTPPTVVSSKRANANPSVASSVGFTVTFSENVTGVDATDFTLTNSGVSGAFISGVSGTGSIYTVIVNTGIDNGSIQLNVVDDDSILDVVLYPLGGAGVGNGNFTSGESYTIQKPFSPVSRWTSAFDLSHGWTVADFVRTAGDVNGDGKADLVGFGLDGVYVALSNGTSFDPVPSRWTTAFDLSHGWTVAQYVRTVGDVNGDGKADLIGFGLDGVYVALSTGSGFGSVSRWTSAFDLSHGWTVKDFVRTVGDVNGDGKADLIGFGQDGVYVALSNGTSFDPVPSRWTSAFDLSHGWTVKDFVRTMGDVNGDGKADLIGFGLDGAYVALSNGTSFEPVASRWTSAFDLSHGWTVKDFVRTVGDVNGGGKADLIGFGQDGVYAALSNGTSFEPAASQWTDAFDLSHGWTVKDFVRTMGDVNGDGKADLIGFGLDGVYVATVK
jgi:hypothetical protein